MHMHTYNAQMKYVKHCTVITILNFFSIDCFTLLKITVEPEVLLFIWLCLLIFPILEMKIEYF